VAVVADRLAAGRRAVHPAVHPVAVVADRLAAGRRAVHPAVHPVAVVADCLAAEILEAVHPVAAGRRAAVVAAVVLITIPIQLIAVGTTAFLVMVEATLIALTQQATCKIG
jgi:hypothetical protein